jgi:glycosyltransferase involved in cell wall biosynthesis
MFVVNRRTRMTGDRTANPNSLVGDELELSIVMPCLNEVESLGSCIAKASSFLQRAGVRGEIIVADNGSTDGSIEIAKSLGARVVRVERRGYGAALSGGFRAACGRFLIMGDADDTYDFGDLMPFIQEFRKGSDLVIGNRFLGGIQPGAMPPLHRYVGNPVLTWLARFLFGISCGDVYCGLRGLSRSAFEKLQLRSQGMEYALEMVAKATVLGMRIAEVPTTLSPDRRSRVPHLRTWSDGRRSLRTYMLFSPNWLFLYPGLLMILAGMIAGGWILSTTAVIGRLHFSVLSLLYCAAAILLGFQAVCFSVFTRIIAVSGHLTPVDPVLEKLVSRVRVYHGLAAGIVLMILGFVGATYTFVIWERSFFGHLDPFRMMRIAIPSVLSLALGAEIALASLFLSLLKVQFLETGTHGRTAEADSPQLPTDGAIPASAGRSASDRGNHGG